MEIRLDCTALPVGKPFDSVDKPPADSPLAAWQTPLTPHRYWKRPSHFEVVEAEGGRVLEHAARHDDALIAGDRFWRDYRVEAEMTQLDAGTSPNNDDRFAVTGKTGLFARYQNLRHYYLFCLEGLNRLCLYRRADEDWHLLGERLFAAEKGHYYTLGLEVEGDRLRCTCDGEEAFCVRDTTYSAGKMGWRTNTASRLRRIVVTSGEASDRTAARTRAAFAESERAQRASYPQPTLWRSIPKGDLAGTVCLVGHPTDAASWQFFCFPSTSVLRSDQQASQACGVLDLNGDVLWRREMSLRFPRLADVNDDGRDEIVCFLDDCLTLLDGSSGAVLKQTPLPEVRRKDGTVGPLSPEFNGTALADLSGVGHPTDIVLKEEDHSGGHNLWAYNCDLEPLWQAVVPYPKYGHGIDFCDVNADGRDEVMAGYSLLTADGELIRRIEGCEEIPPLGSDHADVVALGFFSEDPERALVGINTGSDGFWLADAMTGAVLAKHRVGHAQGISVGKFCPGVPGLQFLVGTRWDNYGILSFFSAQGERLFTFEPDNVSQGGPAVNWGGDGRELLFLFSTAPVLGLYDEQGRKVVEFPDDLPEREFYGKIGGAPFVYDLVGDPREEIIFNFADAIRVYTQDRAYPRGERIYAPLRRRENILPCKSVPHWVENTTTWPT